METKKQNYTLPIIVMIFLFGMISFVTNLASPMGDILKYQFNVPNWMGTPCSVSIVRKNLTRPCPGSRPPPGIWR